MNEVIKNLWHGGTLDGEISRDGFDLVISLESSAPDGVHLVPMEDGEMTPEMAEQVRILAAIINLNLLQEKKVLVYCSAGWNRSGVVAARALMGRGFNCEEAIGAVRQARGPNALSNPFFVAWLQSEQGA